MVEAPAPIAPDVFLRPREVAARTGLALATLASLRCRGQGPSYRKVNRAIFYEWRAVCAWLGEERQSTSDNVPSPRAA